VLLDLIQLAASPRKYLPNMFGNPLSHRNAEHPFEAVLAGRLVDNVAHPATVVV